MSNDTFLSICRLTMATGPPNYKIILCGEYGVGKSSIFRRFMNDTFTMETGKKSTIGLDQSARGFNINGTDVKVRTSCIRMRATMALCNTHKCHLFIIARVLMQQNIGIYYSHSSYDSKQNPVGLRNDYFE